MSDLKSLASDLLRLHHTDETLVLPTVWDVWSARAVVDAGFPALTIGSHPLADSRGQQDGEGMTLDDALDGIRRICSAVRVPVSADVESGYDTRFIQEQVGHEYASTTGIYQFTSDEFRRSTLRAALDRTMNQALSPDDRSGPS